VNPTIVACSFILSGLRVFDIRDPQKPREIAYFNQPAPITTPLKSGAYAMSAPAFAPERNEIWYSDGNSGFYNVRLTNGACRSVEPPRPRHRRLPRDRPRRLRGVRRSGRPRRRAQHQGHRHRPPRRAARVRRRRPGRPAGRRAVRGEAVEELGGLDVLVNNAGVTTSSTR
jgi:hypothetical protein